MPDQKSLDRRRELKPASLDELVDDVQGLLENGYDSLGKWNLAQVCGHCSDWMRFPMDGYPKPSFLVRGMLWSMKILLGKRMLKTILESKSMRAGSPTLPATVPSVDEQDDRNAVHEFVKTVERFKNFEGKISPSPLYGSMDKKTATQLQLVHCSHHLSFLCPKNG